MRTTGLLVALTLCFFTANAQAETLALSVANAEVLYDRTTSMPVVQIKLSSESAKAVSRFTGDHVGETIKVRFDDRTLSEPVVRERIHGDLLQVGGDMTQADAEKLAADVRSGSGRLSLESSDK